MSLPPSSFRTATNRTRFEVILVALALSPFYFDFASGATNLGLLALNETTELSQAVHFAFFVPIVMLAVAAIRRTTDVPPAGRKLPSPVPQLIGAFFVTATAAVFIALLWMPEASNTDRYFQTVLVTLPVFLARDLSIDQKSLGRTILVASTASTAIMLVFVYRHFGLTALGGRERLRVADTLPQILVYLPFVSVIALAASVLLTDQPRLLRICAAASGAAFLSINYSRTTILAALGAMLLAVWVTSVSAGPGTGQRRGLNLFGAVAGVTITLISGFASAAATRGVAQGLQSGRTAIARNALSRIARSPLWGEGFIARDDTDPKPYDAHNQFLEYLLRGGVIGGTCLIIAVALILGVLWKAAKRPTAWQPIHRLAFVLFAVTLLGGMGNPYLTQLFPGVFVWWLVGISLTHRSRTASHEARPALATAATRDYSTSFDPAR